jgi:hypothetical protein
MGLTDREKKIIEEMEAALTAEDPKLVATMERAPRRFGLNIAGIILGIALILTGVITKTAILGILGFLVALASAATIRIKPIAAKIGVGSRASRASRASKRSRIQDRWDRRNEQ